jgi:hypothetical protein
VRAVPLQPCRRHGKKRKEDEPDAVIGRKDPATLHRSPCSVGAMDHRGTPMSLDMASMLEGMEAAQLQSSQVPPSRDCLITLYQRDLWG